jgi:dTDP-4-amino-4,6-dideoxygalactose transaminase
MRKLANHGQTQRYFHDFVGVNSRLDSIQAAILRIKLSHLDSYNQARNKAAEFYNKAFAPIDSITTPKIASFSTHLYHQYTIKLNGVDREALQNHLNSKGIPNNIYYPKQNHKQEAFQATTGVLSMPNTEQLGREVLSLPMHTELTTDQLEFITSEIISFINE